MYANRLTADTFYHGEIDVDIKFSGTFRHMNPRDKINKHTHEMPPELMLINESWLDWLRTVDRLDEQVKGHNSRINQLEIRQGIRDLST